MSNYRSVALDYPGRIEELMQGLDQSARAMDREVTFTLALGAAAITVPLERLEKAHKLADVGRSSAEDFVQDLRKQSFLGSRLVPGGASATWSYGGPLASVDGDPDSWPELSRPEPLAQGPTCWQLLRHLRNALAHGNVYTLGWPSIERIVFLSWVSLNDHRFMYLIASLSDFKALLANWFKELSGLRLPTAVIPELLPAA